MVPGGISKWWAFCLEVRFLEVHFLGQFKILVQNTMIALYFYLSPMLNRMRFTFDLLPVVENKLFSSALVAKPIPQGKGNKLTNF